MAFETAQLSLDYLNEEILELIQNNHINESNFILLRLQKLLEKSRIRFGDDPQNVIFRKVLRLCLKQMNFFLANYLLDNFLNESNLKPISNETPDMLFLTMYYIKNEAKEFYENLQTNTNNLNNLLRNRSTFNYLNRSNPFNQLNNRNQNNRSLLNIQHFNQQPTITYSAKACDFLSFNKLIDKLIIHSNLNQYYLTYRTSLLQMVIENIHSAELNLTCKLTLKERLFQICYNKLMKLDYLDVNVGYNQNKNENLNNQNEFENEINQNQKSNKLINNTKKINNNNQQQQIKKSINQSGIINILQISINDCKYEVARRLVLKGARIDDLNIDDVIFVKSTEELFRTLYFAGFRFLPVNIFRMKYDQTIKDDECFESFCEFLKKHQTKQLPLSCLAWNVLRKTLGSKSNLLLQFLEDLNLPDGFLKYARFESLEILFQKS